ncbi:MAG: cell division protein ZapA [Methyloglobulus sp.]|nr:cell division protein ZapA [Methyloglobulus sp.]
MNNKPQTVSVTIMGKEYKIVCESGEQDNLIKSASDLDTQMCKMRDSGKVSGPERIAVMAALNLSHELQTLKKQSPIALNQSWKDCFTSMMIKIENALEKD